MDLTQKTRLQGSWRNHLLAFLIPFCGMLLVMLVVMLAVPHLRKRKNQREENHHEEHP